MTRTLRARLVSGALLLAALVAGGVPTATAAANASSHPGPAVAPQAICRINC
jgi:hypothetical protein